MFCFVLKNIKINISREIKNQKDKFSCEFTNLKGEKKIASSLFNLIVEDQYMSFNLFVHGQSSDSKHE